MRAWVRQHLVKTLGPGVPENVVAEAERIAEQNELKDNEPGRQFVLADLLLRPASSLPQQQRESRRQGRIARGLLSKVERLRAAVTAAAMKRLASGEPEVVAVREAWDLPLDRKSPEPAMDADIALALLRFVSKLPPAAQAELLRVQGHLASKFGWTELDAQWFVVAGISPDSPPVRLELGSPITMKVQPWVSPETVKAIYAEAQRRVRGHAHHGLGVKALGRFDFVHRARTGGRTTYARLFEAWKRKLPPAQRGGTWKNFARDYARTERRLLHPTLSPAFKALVAREAKERVALRLRAANELNLGPLVRLGLRLPPAQAGGTRPTPR